DQHSFAQDDTADDPMNRSQRPCRGQVSVAPSRGRVSTCFKPRPVPDEIDVDVTVRLCDGWLQRAGSLTVEPGALGNYAELPFLTGLSLARLLAVRRRVLDLGIQLRAD